LRHGRFADLFSIAMAPTLALAISAVLVERTRALRAMICSILGALILFGAADHVNRTRFRLDYGPEVFGKGPLDFVEEEHLSGPAFLSDGWAGPFLARFYPHQRVFFFPAFDAFLPQHYREYMDIRYGKPGWAERLDALGVELCVLKYTSPNERRYQGGEPNLRQHLARDARWALLYFDDLGEIFVRRAGANATAHPSLIADHAIRGLDPDRLEWFSVGDETRSPLEWLRERQANRGAPSRRLGWPHDTTSSLRRPESPRPSRARSTWRLARRAANISSSSTPRTNLSRTNCASPPRDSRRTLKSTVCRRALPWRTSPIPG